MNRYLLDLLDRFLQCVMGNTELMWGKIVLLIHDFRQILPVIPGGKIENIVAVSIKNREIWVDVVHLALTQNMIIEKLMHDNLSQEWCKRLQQFSKWLLRIGNGTADVELINIFEIPKEMTFK